MLAKQPGPPWAPNPFVPADCHCIRGWTSLKPWRTQALKRKPCCTLLACRSLPPAGHVGLPALAAELAVVARKAGKNTIPRRQRAAPRFLAIAPGQQTHWEGIAGNLKPLFRTSLKQQIYQLPGEPRLFR